MKKKRSYKKWVGSWITDTRNKEKHYVVDRVNWLNPKTQKNGWIYWVCGIDQLGSVSISYYELKTYFK